MHYLDSLAIIALAALIHASFQLSVSMLTVMSGHALGRKTAHARLLRLSGSFILGGMLMITLLLCFTAMVLQNAFDTVPPLVWAGASGLSVGVGIAVWSFYYRHRRTGTVLWLPRPMASYLEKRARKTRYPAESFTLGLGSVAAEILFAIAPLLIASLVLVRLPAPLQLGGLALYTLVASLPLIVIYLLIGGGHSLGKIQHWRETNKRFLQFAAGSALIILGAYLYVDTLFAETAGLASGLGGIL